MGNVSNAESSEENQVIEEGQNNSKNNSPVKTAAIQTNQDIKQTSKPILCLKMNKKAFESDAFNLPPLEYKSKKGTTVNEYSQTSTIYKFEDGSTYQGGMDALLSRNGIGVCVTKEGDVYEGTWVADKPDGIGRFIRYNGDYYQGGFKNGLPDGYGISREGEDKVKYEGDWVKSFKTGQGKVTFTDGSFFSGDH